MVKLKIASEKSSFKGAVNLNIKFDSFNILETEKS